MENKQSKQNRGEIDKMMIMPSQFSTMLCIARKPDGQIMLIVKRSETTRRNFIGDLASTLSQDPELAMDLEIALGLTKEYFKSIMEARQGHISSKLEEK